MQPLFVLKNLDMKHGCIRVKEPRDILGEAKYKVRLVKSHAFIHHVGRVTLQCASRSNILTHDCRSRLCIDRRHPLQMFGDIVYIPSLHETPF